MLDLNTIFGMREQMLPQEGFWGFILEHWLVVAVVIMGIGFIIDQVLYIVRYRPQDKIVRMIKQCKKLIARLSGKELPEEEERFEEELIETEPEAPEDTGEAIDYEDAPVIRRGGARYTPESYPPSEPVMKRPEKVPDDDDAPVVVRSAAKPVVRRPAQQEEPRTKS